MEIIFYLFTFAAILYEHYKLMNPLKVQEKLAKIKSDQNDGKDMDTRDATFVLLSIGYVFWAFVGLLTSQWIIFLIMLVMGISMGVIFGKKLPKIVVRIDSFITVVLLFFMLINKFHLHIDLYQFILNLF